MVLVFYIRRILSRFAIYIEIIFGQRHNFENHFSMHLLVFISCVSSFMIFGVYLVFILHFTKSAFSRACLCFRFTVYSTVDRPVDSAVDRCWVLRFSRELRTLWMRVYRRSVDSTVDSPNSRLSTALSTAGKFL